LKEDKEKKDFSQDYDFNARVIFLIGQIFKILLGTGILFLILMVDLIGGKENFDENLWMI
jgi:hypothetical protein